jgi:hypothetical protein
VRGAVTACVETFQTKFARPKQNGALVVFMMELALLSSVGFFG